MHGQLLGFSLVWSAYSYQFKVLLYFFTLTILCCFRFSKLLYTPGPHGLRPFSLYSMATQLTGTWGMLFPSIVLYPKGANRAKQSSWRHSHHRIYACMYVWLRIRVIWNKGKNINFTGYDFNRKFSFDAVWKLEHRQISYICFEFQWVVYCIDISEETKT